MAYKYIHKSMGLLMFIIRPVVIIALNERDMQPGRYNFSGVCVTPGRSHNALR